MAEASPDKSNCIEAGDAVAAADVNLFTVVIMLAVLVALVAAVFWALPAWFGSSTITVNVRN